MPVQSHSNLLKNATPFHFFGAAPKPPGVLACDG